MSTPVQWCEPIRAFFRFDNIPNSTENISYLTRVHSMSCVLQRVYAPGTWFLVWHRNVALDAEMEKIQSKINFFLFQLLSIVSWRRGREKEKYCYMVVIGYVCVVCCGVCTFYGFCCEGKYYYYSRNTRKTWHQSEYLKVEAIASHRECHFSSFQVDGNHVSRSSVVMERRERTKNQRIYS